MSGADAPSSRVGVVVPIRSFVGAKARLAQHLDEHERAAAFRQMADRVVDAAAPLTVLIVSSAPEVREWAEARGLAHVDDPGSLDGAATAGVDWMHAAGSGQAIVTHADLPRARNLARLAGGPTVVTLVPCHRSDGTNVIALPTDAGFRFAYGPGSFERHVREVRRVGLDLVIDRDPDLMVDIDLPDDLRHLRSTSEP